MTDDKATGPYDTPERRMKYHASVLGVIARKIGYAETVRLLASIPEAQVADAAGSDADNGAMGEREAFEAWAKERFPAKYLSSNANSNMDDYRECAREGFERGIAYARAALTAEKVAAERFPAPISISTDKICEIASKYNLGNPRLQALRCFVNEIILVNEAEYAKSE
jgi:hypothetical protein